MAEIWYCERTIHQVAHVGEILHVMRFGDPKKEPLLFSTLRDVRLAEYVQVCVGPFFCKFVQEPNWFGWIVHDNDRLDAVLPDAVFVANGIEKGQVQDSLYRRMMEVFH